MQYFKHNLKAFIITNIEQTGAILRVKKRHSQINDIEFGLNHQISSSKTR